MAPRLPGSAAVGAPAMGRWPQGGGAGQAYSSKESPHEEGIVGATQGGDDLGDAMEIIQVEEFDDQGAARNSMNKLFQADPEGDAIAGVLGEGIVGDTQGGGDLGDTLGIIQVEESDDQAA